MKNRAAAFQHRDRRGGARSSILRRECTPFASNFFSVWEMTCFLRAVCRSGQSIGG